tara:strand:+ start:2390 stop:2491 length:102 start_codon:yes stop_codon:yes gene_type:complete
MIKVILFAVGFSIVFFGGIILIDKGWIHQDDFR